MTDRIDVAVVGAGQAGLSVSHELRRADVSHVVLERGRVAETWRRRWDSFCLVTPNWSLRLPGHGYAGSDPDGFLPRDGVTAYLERYAVDAPVREGVEVTALRRRRGGFLLETSEGSVAARAVVLCTGAYQRPHRPPAAAALPAGLFAIDVGDYRNPSDLPSGPVLVVGSGQSGCQIAEELQLAGRTVFLSCGRAPWLPRRFGGRDLVWWALESGYLDAPLASLPTPAARLAANLTVTGTRGGHDLHLRTLQAQGVTLLGRLAGASGHHARFAPDLADSVAWGDQRQLQFMGLVKKLVDERGLPDPGLAPPTPFRADAPEHVDLHGFGAVVFAGGFRPDYGRWVQCRGAFDAAGFPVQRDGSCTAVEGLHFAGVHFLRKRKSSLLIGVGEDAAIVAKRIASRLTRRRAAA
jgi:putative flavoprotein involved in K+ transport